MGVAGDPEERLRHPCPGWSRYVSGLDGKIFRLMSIRSHIQWFCHQNMDL